MLFLPQYGRVLGFIPLSLILEYRLYISPTLSSFFLPQHGRVLGKYRRRLLVEKAAPGLPRDGEPVRVQRPRGEELGGGAGRA